MDQGHTSKPKSDPAIEGHPASTSPDLREKGPDRRKNNVGGPSGLERRRGPGRRLSDFTKAAEEGELTPEQFLFVMAIEDFKRANQKQYPSWTDVIEVVRLLGYRKTMPSEIRLRSAEDWHEGPSTPSNVRPANFARRFQKDLEALRDEFGGKADAA
jgi:hypothetical protein